MDQNRDFYTLVDPDTMRRWGKYNVFGRARRALLNALTEGNNIAGQRLPVEILERLVVMRNSEFREMDTEIEVKNLMTGNPVKIRRSERGTCTDPSTEAYWQM